VIGIVRGRTARLRKVLHRRVANPNRTMVYNTAGTLIAVFTDNARTVSILGATPRTFTENKDTFIDEFKRTLSSKAGQSPGGGTWNDFNGSAADYNVSTDKLRIATPTVNVSRYVRLNDILATWDVRMKVTTTTTPAGNANSAAIVGGFTDVSNHMRYRLTFNSTGSVQGAITKNVAGSETNITGTTTIAASGYVAGQVWNVRGKWDGTTHSLFAWKEGDTESTTAVVTTTDSTFPTGKLGIRTFASTGATNAPGFEIDDYQATLCTWATLPSVTHNWRVRVLPAPFTGAVDNAWLAAALADSSADLLAIGMEYITGGSKEAEYGPVYVPGRSWDVAHADDGTRQEGADWNDYLGVTGNYPGLATTTDAPEAHQLGCLDCSGFVRTVFGYRGGLPMCLDDAIDYNGARIPRRSVDQAANGPGVIITSNVGAAPTSFTELMPGDVLYWDADTTNPTEEEGQVDHSGIYLGVDANGDKRFLSSRKVASGPTLGDLGGASIINGTGLYARALRTVRRF
jgi:cell wall-associated NlpC family hydrolase